MARYHRHSFSWYKCSFSCKTRPRRVSIGRCIEWLKEKRYTIVQMGPVAIEVRSRFWAILPATGQTLQAACSVLPPCSHELMPTSPLHCHIPLLCCNPHILRLLDGDIMTMEGDSGQKCKHYCNTVVIQVVHIVRMLLSRASKCYLKEVLLFVL